MRVLRLLSVPMPMPMPVAGLLVVLGLLAACSSMPSQPPTAPVEPAPSVLRYLPADWQGLPGWQADDTRAAWPALLASCGSPRIGTAWAGFCTQARAIDAGNAAAQRALIESRLRPWQVVLDSPGSRSLRQERGLITGYYEPVLNGARQRGGRYQTPLYAVPDDLVPQLADGRALAGREIVWVDSAVDAFFLQIQGSGRVRLPDGTVLRLAFADVNGHPYRAIGRYLVEQGELTVEEATAPGLRQWLAENPQRQQEVFNTNPSVVFFSEQAIGDPAVGPNGALGLPLTAGRSLAIDPRLLPLGAPMYLATLHPLTGAPLERLMLAQDTGGAIRGALRADYFWGLGQEAGEAAGRMRHEGALWLLWPADQPLPAVTAATAP